MSMPSELYLKFLALDAEVQGHIHAGLRCAPLHNKAYVRRYSKKLKELQNARDKAREEWRESVKDDPKPTRQESMIKAAQGHPDLESVQAARRICEKYGWDWKIVD